MSDTIRLVGRVLYLSQDPAVIEAQLAGENFTRVSAGPLRDNVSTDEITPVTVMLTYDERLGQYPYVGFKAGERMPIGRNAIKDGGFQVTVAGKRYGKGSSRESSPLAELSAGIRLIVAESFERIYQQNCDNIGILTTTDFSVLDRLIAGEAVPIDEFLKGRDALTQQIIRSGGLLAYSKFADWPAPRVRETANLAPTAAPANTTHATNATTATNATNATNTPEPKTLVEKIIERHLHPGIESAQRGDGVFIAADWRFSHDYFTGMCAHLMHRA
ncbi:MAG TPA: 3-isopropylmalate dehydratase, partial [Paraburkholderia sp.]|nr:3-isopropylmalate dehydratase [Paraburkholderia sp.]